MNFMFIKLFFKITINEKMFNFFSFSLILLNVHNPSSFG